MATVKDLNDINKQIENELALAVEETACEIQDKLRDFIKEDFYDQYSPKRYERSGQLLNSPTVEFTNKKMTNARIKINMDSFQRIYREDGLDAYIADPSLVVDLAVRGYHGRKDIQTDGRFWNDFKSWCDKNVEKILLNNIKRRGINIC